MGRHKKQSNIPLSEIIEMYLQGYSLYKISQKSGLHPQSVKRRLQENKIQVRNLKQSMDNRRNNED